MLPEAAVDHDHIRYGPPSLSNREQASVKQPLALAYKYSVVTKAMNGKINKVCKGNPFAKTKPETSDSRSGG